MEDVGLILAGILYGLSRIIFKIHAAESGKGNGAIVISRHVAIEGGNGVDPHREQVIGVGLEEGKRVWRDLADLGEEVGVASLAQTLNLLFASESRQIVFLVSVRAGQM